MTSEIADITTRLEPVARMTRDLRAAAATLSDHEARFLVDAYYMMQENRIRSAHQVRQLGQSGEPNSVLSFLEDQSSTIEGQIKSALDRYSGAHPVGHAAVQRPLPVRPADFDGDSRRTLRLNRTEPEIDERPRQPGEVRMRGRAEVVGRRVGHQRRPHGASGAEHQPAGAGAGRTHAHGDGAHRVLIGCSSAGRSAHR